MSSDAPENGQDVSARRRAAFAFNKIMIDFIMSIKQENADLKATLRKNYRVIDNTSEEDVSRLAGLLSEDCIKDVLLTVNPLEVTVRLADLEILKGCTLGDIQSKLPQDSQLCNYVYLLFVLAAVYKECGHGSAEDDSGSKTSDDEKTDGMLLEKVLNIVSKIQSASIDIEDDLDEVFDDDLRGLLQQLNTATAQSSAAVATDDVGGEDEHVFEKLMDSKIGKLAAEISSEIDPTQLDMSNPMDMLDFKKLADGSSPIGGIITKVGSKIQDKIKSGELNQSELLSEAMSMLKMFDSQNALGNLMSQARKAGVDLPAGQSSSGAGPSPSDMFAQLQQMMGNGTSAGGSSASRATRERLRKKLQVKKT
jgi:hypothetical protein